MADTTIGAKLTLDAGGAITNVKNFKQELRLAQESLISITKEFGATSKEAAAAAQKAAGLKDAIGDAKSLVDAFNPDTKFRAFGASINTVVGGFTALQGVMGLVGVESEETQKALLKVQSALAISQGLSQLQEGVQTFKNLGAVIQSTTLFQKANNIVTTIAAAIMRAFGVSTTGTATAMNVLKGAIIATGIGALVVLLAVAADALGLFSSKSDEAAESQEKLKQQIDGVNESLQAQGTFFSNEEKLEIAKAKRRGASEAEVFAIQEKYRHLNYDATLAAYEKVKGLDEIEAAKLRKQLDAQNIAGQVAQIDFETKENDRRLAAEKEFNAKLKAQKAAAKKQEVADALEEIKRQNAGFKGAGEGLNIEIPKTVEQQQIENTVAAAHKALSDKEGIFLGESDLRSKNYTDAKDDAINQMLLDEQVYQNRLRLAGATSDILSSLSQLVGQQTTAGKVFAIAAATIDTFVAANAILRASAKTPAGGIPGYAIAQMAAVIITGLINVKKIASVKVPGGGGGGAAPAPTVAPLIAKPEQQTTTLDQNSINAIGNATTRAFVLESDISGSQERIRRLNRQARLGG